jgi:hypothetical protein
MKITRPTELADLFVYLDAYAGNLPASWDEG